MDHKAIFETVKKYILMQLPIDEGRITEIANMIDRELYSRNSYQGKKFNP